MSNHLKNETSPYLLQHAENPVDWYPWGKEAFEKARRENKPIFLSIGYSTCHWCHVMAHESFEDREIADILNEHFIAIKVDREERPDVDSIYMGICQVFSGQGGWPLTVFMTAEQEPFFAGTYYPKESRGSRIGFKDMLLAVHEKWEKDREDLCHRARFLVEDLQRLVKEAGKASMELPALAVEFYKNQFDEEHGGFGMAPKFPMPHNLWFLLAYGERYHDMACLEMAEKTLIQMYRGGLFDHIGYGFCRYSTDEKFLAPHFEKMLYDNALLILAYCKAFAVTGKEIYKEIAEKTASYILKEMTSPEGGFYSAQDADSDGEEGKYYLFTPDEILSLLGEKDGSAFNQHYDITKDGNFEGKNIPNLLQGDYGESSFDSRMEELQNYRKERSFLHLDDKILTFWNSLMIAAMCELYRATGEEKYREAAKKANEFIRKNLMENDKLFVSFREGKRGVEGFLDDYAGYLFAQLALYGATLDVEYFHRAEEICGKVLENFKDEERGGFFFYGKDSENLILRLKETYDGAMPSGNSLMAWNLVRLSHMTGEGKYAEEAARQLDFLAADAEKGLTGYAMYLLALLEYLDPAVKITVVKGENYDKEQIIREIPHDAVVLLLEEASYEYPLLGEKTTYYVCRDHCCRPPVYDLKEVH